RSADDSSLLHWRPEKDMRTGPLAGVAAVLALAGSSTPARVSAAGPVACEALKQVPIAGGTLISAESVQAGAFTPPNAPNASAAAVFQPLPAFCRVTARLTPPHHPELRVAVSMPHS